MKAWLYAMLYCAMAGFRLCPVAIEVQGASGALAFRTFRTPTEAN